MYALTHLVSNPAFPLFDTEQRSNRMEQPTIEQQVEDFIQHPEKMQAALVEIFLHVNAQQIVLSLLIQFLQRVQDHPQAARQCAYQIMMTLPASIARSILEEQPELFAQLLNCLNENQRREMLKQLTHQLENWKFHFEKVFCSLNRSGEERQNPQDFPAGSFLVTLVGSLSPKRTKQWIKHCSNELSYEDWGFFILTLGEKSRTFALNVCIHFFDFDLSEYGFRHCFEALALQSTYKQLVASVLDKILHKFYRANEFDKIVNQFNQLSLHAQVCLLNTMSSSKQNQILRQNCQNLPLMASWMDELFSYQQEFSSRKNTVKRMCSFLQEGSLTEFIRQLNERRSKIGAYFLICLSPQHFQEFAFTVPYRIRSEVLSNSLADATASQVLYAISTNNERGQMIYESVGLNMDNPVIPVDTFYTLKQCFDVLQQMSQAPDLASDYIPFISRIPPVLIGLLSMNPDRRNVLLQLASQLSDEQLKFLVCVLPSDVFSVFIEKNWSSLNNEQYIAMLEGLSLSQLIDFIKAKTEKLQLINVEFQNKYKSVQEALEKIKGSAFISSSFLGELEKEVNHLSLLTRRPSYKDYHCLKIFLQRLQQSLPILHPIIQELQQTANHLNNKRILFEGPHALIRTQLSALKNFVVDKETIEENEETDLTLVLYEGFWTLVREGTLPYLGISPHSQLGIIHPGQLNFFGIKSNADLHLLGISPEWQNRVDKLANEVKKLQASKEIKMHVKANSLGDEKEKNSSFHDLWQIFISIKTPSNELESICRNILQTLPVQQLELIELKKTCLAFGQELLLFQHISIDDRNQLTRGMQELEKCHQPQILIDLALQLLGLELIVLRNQYPLICLQRYLLDNKNLKQAWEKFHSHKCFSLIALVEKGFVKTSADILKLENIANKI